MRQLWTKNKQTNKSKKNLLQNKLRRKNRIFYQISRRQRENYSSKEKARLSQTKNKVIEINSTMVADGTTTYSTELTEKINRLNFPLNNHSVYNWIWNRLLP